MDEEAWKKTSGMEEEKRKGTDDKEWKKRNERRGMGGEVWKERNDWRRVKWMWRR
jgi:hypothetical protein